MGWRKFTEEERSEIRKSIIAVGRTETAKRFNILISKTYQFMNVVEFREEKEKFNIFRSMCIVCGKKREFRLFCKLHHYRYIADPKKEKKARRLSIMQKYGLK